MGVAAKRPAAALRRIATLGTLAGSRVSVFVSVISIHMLVCAVARGGGLGVEE